VGVSFVFGFLLGAATFALIMLLALAVCLRDGGGTG